MRLRTLITALGLGATTVSPLAMSAELTGPYFGGSYGLYRFDNLGLDEEDTMWKAFIGAHLNNWLGIEGGYVFMDRAENQGSSFEAEGFTAAALITFPIAQKSAFFIKGGGFWWDAETRGAVNTNRSNSDPFYGAGFRIGLAENFSLRLEYERYEVVDTDIDTASIGLQANF